MFIATEDFGFIPAEVERIAEIIHDWNPELELRIIPERARTPEDTHPYAIFHRNKHGYEYLVRTMTPEEMDHRLIAWLFEADTKRHDVLARIEREEAARKLMDMRAQMDREEEARELTKAIITSPKSEYRHNGKVFK